MTDTLDIIGIDWITPSDKFVVDHLPYAGVLITKATPEQMASMVSHLMTCEHDGDHEFMVIERSTMLYCDSDALDCLRGVNEGDPRCTR